MIGSISNGISQYNISAPMTRNEMIQAARSNDTADIPAGQLRELKRTGAVECATCASRKYQDGSDENVSFKSAAHISPEASAAKVKAHENEHVSNAYKEAEEKGGRVVRSSVSLKTSICPECGRSFVAGGLTKSTIAYSKDDAYSKAQKAYEADVMKGNNVNYSV